MLAHYKHGRFAARTRRWYQHSRAAHPLRRLEDLLRRATGRALVGTVVGSIPGFVLPFAIAVHFRIGGLTDVYVFALSVAVFASGVFSGVLQANVLPILQRMKRLGRSAFIKRLNAITISSSGVVILLYSFIAVVSVLYTARRSHWTAQQHELLLMTTIAFSIFVLASSVNSILSASLNALDRFLAPAATQVVKSLGPLAVIPFIARDANGLLLVACLVSAGELLQTAFLRAQLSRALPTIPERTVPESHATELPLWRVATPHGLSLFIAAASPLIDRSVAATLSAGSVTLLDLGERVFYVPLTIISASFVLVAGTHWSSIHTTNVPALRQHFWRTIVRGALVCLALLAAMGVALSVFAAVANRTFAGAPTGQLLAIIALLLAGLPPAFVIAAGARLLTSTRTTYLLPWFAVCSLGFNTLFDILGASWFGVEGIAVASTMYRCVTASLLLIAIHRLMKTHFRGLFPHHNPAPPPAA
jgi:peptidoglycan biosynthesis protein MviN/MurJ (putative lipid II flippase)